MKYSKCASPYCVKAEFNHTDNAANAEIANAIHTNQDKNAAKRTLALYLYVVGLSMNAIGRILKVEPSTILYWVKKFCA